MIEVEGLLHDARRNNNRYDLKSCTVSIESVETAILSELFKHTLQVTVKLIQSIVSCVFDIDCPQCMVDNIEL